MKKIAKKFAVLSIVLFLSTVVYGQCWSVNATATSSDKSSLRPSRTNANEAIILSIEPVLQKAMGVTSNTYMIEPQIVRADPTDGSVYFGKRFLRFMEETYAPVIKQTGQNPIPAGIELIVAHEYAHQFQFRMFKKKKLNITSPSVIDELQADILGAYFYHFYLMSKFLSLSKDQQTRTIPGEASGAIMIVSQLGDPYFNDENHHGSGGARNAAIQSGLTAAGQNKFGALSDAMLVREDEIFDWSRKLAEDIKNQNKDNSRTF